MMEIDTEHLTGRWDCSIDEYHADRQWLSHSALEIFRRSPRLYKMWFDGDWEREQTKEFRIGSALHAMVLEPDSFAGRFDVHDFSNRNSTKFKDAVKADAARDHLLLSEFELVMKMASAIICHSWIDEMIGKADKEVSYRFLEPFFEIPCKVRPDGITDYGIVFDLKTSRDPSEASWVRDAANFGYHRQAAFYLRGLIESKIVLYDRYSFVHIVVGSVEPFDVFAYQIDVESIELGIHETKYALKELKKRRLNNDWRERNHGKIATVRLPAWYLKKGWEE